MATGVGMRVVGLIGTLVLTRFIAPAEYGDVSAAAICVLSANQLAYFAFSQYVIANKSPADVAFQAAVIHFGLGVVAMVIVVFRFEVRSASCSMRRRWVGSSPATPRLY